MKKKTRIIIVVLFLAFLILYMLITAIQELTNKKDLHTVKLGAAVEILQVEHSIIGGLIPIGSDHYFIGIEADSYDVYIIMAPKKWLEKNFDSKHLAKIPDGIEITALARQADNKISGELASQAAQLEDANYPIGTGYYLDVSYRVTAILKLIFSGLSIFLIIMGCYIFSRPPIGITYSTPGQAKTEMLIKCWIVLLIIAVILLFTIGY